MAVAGFFLFAGSLVEANSQTLLGTRNVTDRVDHDTIRVTASRGDFRRIQFRVSRRPIELYRVVVHYGNGADDRLEVRENVRAGGSTRWIDLRGGDRVIRSIEFWYDAGSIGRGGTATIRVYGMH
jgi:hypothetical protein